MIRGTTPTHRFVFSEDIDLKKITRMVITYEQNKICIIEKTEKDVKFDESDPKVAMVTLTQEETFKFNPNNTVKIQVRVLTEEGTALASSIFSKSCDDVLNEEVLR